MNAYQRTGAILLGGLVLGVAALGLTAAKDAGPSAAPDRQQARRTMQAGNFNDAYAMFRKLALDPNADPRQVGQDLGMATSCLQQLNRTNEIDAVREAVIAAHKDNWRLLLAAAENYLNVQHEGFMIAGKFERGPHRGGGEVANAMERDRVRALQLMRQALPKAQQDDNHVEAANFFLSLARMLQMGHRGQFESWRLQTLTNLDELPDYEPGWGYYGGGPQGAPVDEDGNPVFYSVPKRWEDSTNDGQRWRWCLQQAVEFDPKRADAVRLQWAEFLQSQFGVQTMAEYGWRFGRGQTDDTKKDESGPYALSTLGEDETIARLATGIKRFKLPDEFNYVKVYQQVAEEGKGDAKRQALTALAGEFENRRQYPRAAEYWRKVIQLATGDELRMAKDRLAQIVDNWGRFEPLPTLPAGKAATFEYRFRNGKEVEFIASPINVKKLLDDVKAYIKSRPRQLDWQKTNLQDIGFRLVTQEQKQYVGAPVAQWKLALDPREKHFDKRVTVDTPLVKPGAYLVSARMAGGNTSFIIVWLADTAIAKKPLDGKGYVFVADATSGKPLPKANVEFFGWRQQWRQGNRVEIDTKDFAEHTDRDGQVFLTPDQENQQYRWLIIARAADGHFGYLGFTHVWYGRVHDAEYRETKVFTITDRPVYRPAQQVKYKLWVRHAQYDQAETSDFAGQRFTVEIRNPKGEKIQQKSLSADAYGGLEGSYDLPADAALGQYGLMVRTVPNRYLGGGSFRVEEYKKPEFEVSIDAPAEPVMLGEKIAATIKAKYYFGSPVTQAKVKYKVQRTGYTERWYPIGPWDWLYEPGYWWFAYDYDWYPGWRHWGCPRPRMAWWPMAHQPPEVVIEREVPIGPDGTVKVEIDTAVAKAIHPDTDHRYEITAEVVDASRRTIVGQGTVLVARKPFTVTAWVDRGYYRTGDVIQLHAAARTLDGKPVKGAGQLTLLSIQYRDGKPVETPVEKFELPTGEEGTAHIQLRAGRPGQYRFSYKVTDAKEHVIEGGYVFTVYGREAQPSDFRFNALEIVPDKKDYQPGEKVKLVVNANKADATVVLFIRPTNGVYLPPKILRLDGKSALEEIEVVKRDMPNFFVEALTVADGRVYTEAKEVVVPPEKRVLSVDVVPSSESYKPGAPAKVKLKLADFQGKPFVGSTVVAIYDKSVEYISGGSNIPEIKAFFWKWRRHHHPQTEDNLQRRFGNLVRPKDKGMGDLGLFGHGEVDESTREALGDRRGRDLFQNMDGLASSAAPAAAPMPGLGGMADGAPRAMARGAMKAEAKAANLELANVAAGAQGGGGAMVQPTIRKEFADTALWVGALETDKDGLAEVSLKMPENLTTWRIKVWGMGHGTKVGEGQADVVTRKDLIVRLQAPRFFVQKDEVVLSAVVHNYLKTKKKVILQLQLDGEKLGIPVNLVTNSGDRGPGYLYDGGTDREVAANGEARVDWRVKVLDEGEATIRMKALTDEESDAMEQKFPCYVHGMFKQEAVSGVIAPDGTSGEFTVKVPKERRPKQTRLEVRFSPTLAGAMVDALPYLVNYPYGCTEQTLNRFLPTVITQKILIEQGLNLEEIKNKRANLNAQELGDPAQRAKQWKRFPRNPVFDEEEVRRMVKEGVKRLTEMQLSDGGWGWFSGWGEHSDPHTTALVVHGLQIAQKNDVALVPGMVERGVEWLKRHQAEQVRRLKNAEKDSKVHPWKDHADEIDALVYMVLVDAGVTSAEMMDYLYRDRTKIAVYAKAMYALALEKQKQAEKLAMLLRNINQFVQQDDENQTAWLNLPQGFWWCWYGSEYEAQGYYLKLLARTDPKGELARRLVKYLLNNRKHATYWNSTRDTAICVEAMADFLRASGEQKPEMTVEVVYDGKVQKGVEITPQNLFNIDNTFVLEGEAVTDGPHKVELRKRGQGPLYYNGYLGNFTLEDPITRAGLEIKVDRKYYRLKEADKTVKVAGSRGQAVDQKVEKYVRQELANLAELKSGDLVEIELVIQSKNDYEYLVLEDMKPSGFEPVEVRSGYNGNPLGAYVEYRDNRVVFFCRTVARGTHSVSYRMRAETPGVFSALPTRAAAMYAPELKANSDEFKLRVSD